MNNMAKLKEIGFTPLITAEVTHGWKYFWDEDKHGEFLAYRLDNREGTLFYGQYIFVSPEDKDFVSGCERPTWGGFYHKSKHVSVMTTLANRNTFYLHREIWLEAFGKIPDKKYVLRTNHPLDFRRQCLALATSTKIVNGNPNPLAMAQTFKNWLRRKQPERLVA